MREHSTSWTESAGRSFLSLTNLKLLLWPRSTARRLKKLLASKYANSETAKKLDAEKARIMSDRQQTARLRKERQSSSNKLKREEAGQTTVIDQQLNDVENSKL